MHYSRNKKRNIIKVDIICRQLLKLLVQSLHGTAGKHPGIFKTMHEIRQEYYFLPIATYVKNWVRDCEKCI